MTQNTKIMDNRTLFVSLVYATPTNYTDYYDKNDSVFVSDVQGGNRTISKPHDGIGIAVIYSVFCLLGTIANGLVIWFGIFRMKKTVNVVWFTSLAISDFSIVFFLPLNITQHFLGYWPFNKNTCKLVVLVPYLSGLVSVLQLTVISID